MERLSLVPVISFPEGLVCGRLANPRRAATWRVGELRARLPPRAAHGLPQATTVPWKPAKSRLPFAGLLEGRCGAALGGGRAFQGVPEHLFLRLVEGRLEDDTAIMLDLLQHLVGGHFLNKQEQHGT